jgi:hypothetical protein
MYMEWPNRFWAVSFDLILFLDVLELTMNMHLAISSREYKFHNFWIYRSKNYRCLKILGKVWARWACVGANKQELTTRAKR